MHIYDLNHIGQSELQLSQPKSLLKPTPLPQGCPWVPGGLKIPPELSCRGMVLDHQVLKQPKNFSKTAKFDQKQKFLSVFIALASLKLDG